MQCESRLDVHGGDMPFYPAGRPTTFVGFKVRGASRIGIYTHCASCSQARRTMDAQPAASQVTASTAADSLPPNRISYHASR